MAQLSADTNRSGTITVGGTAQDVCAAQSLRRGFVFQNLSAVDMWLDIFGGTAVATQPCIKVPAGAYYEMPVTPHHGKAVSVAKISVFCSTTSSAFHAEEW